jgi:hypothetical protein
MTLQAVAVNRKGKYFRLVDDSKLPFCSMMDINGDETEDADACVIALFQLPDGRFSGVDLRLFGADMQETTQ